MKTNIEASEYLLSKYGFSIILSAVFSMLSLSPADFSRAVFSLLGLFPR